MKVHILEHDPAEGPGTIATWAAARGHSLVRVPLYAGAALPEPREVELLVVMGGPMSVQQHRDHPWLPREKQCIAETVAAGKPVLGICLGAQLIADVLGGKVFQNAEKEIGWWPVRIIDRAPPFAQFPGTLTAMHWHGDTFSLPPGARRIAESEACANQAFAIGRRVVGLQFHPEMLPLGVADLAGACGDELVPARWVQSREQLLATPADVGVMHAALDGVLDAMTNDE
jgi:GMP synthase-like glutamine amidotransferase